MFIVIALYGIGAFLSLIWGYYQTSIKRNPFCLTPQLWMYGIFVWGDAIPIGIFWSTISLFSFWSQNIFLFLLAQTIYWIVRSSGEIIYWFLQQFAQTKRDQPETLFGHKLFPGESIWFVYQLTWQLVLVVSIMCLIYLLKSNSF